MLSLEERKKLSPHELNPSRDTPEVIYHYTDRETTRKILTKDGLCFRMTRAEDFEDQSEGRTLEEYYQEAIENLRESGFLTDTHYRVLRKAKMPEMKPMTFYNPVDPSSIYFQGTRYTAYVSCFSTEKDDPKMIERYMKNESKKGYCIGVSSIDLNTNETTYTLGKGYCFVVQKILYKPEMVRYMEDFVRWMYSVCPQIAEEDIQPFFVDRVQHEFLWLRYSSKKDEFRWENEVRLVLYVPEECNEPTYHFPFTESCEKGKRYIDVHFPQYVLQDVSKAECITQEEYIEDIRHFVNLGYAKLSEKLQACPVAYIDGFVICEDRFRKLWYAELPESCMSQREDIPIEKLKGIASLPQNTQKKIFAELKIIPEMQKL